MTAPLISGDPSWVGPYEVLARLGVGGMGVVYLGRSPGGRLVAVKLVRPELAADTGFRRRFSDEVTAARKVGGFYTAQVVDADPDGEPAWLATAYIPGLSLQQAVTEHGPLPWTSVAMLGAGLAEGLAAVHAQELVHRDLKPANVILAPDGPRLIDFGIARALDATSYTQTHTVLGTAPFMSPEQATSKAEIGPASDIFSLGCVLGFALTGLSPFGDGAWHAVGYRIVHDDPDLTGPTQFSPQLADLMKRCLAKAPESRPALDSVLHELAGLARVQQPGQQTQWLPDDLTATIAQRATDVLHGTSVLPPEQDHAQDPAHDSAQAAQAAQAADAYQPPPSFQPPSDQPPSDEPPDVGQQDARSEAVPKPRTPKLARLSWPASPPTRRARVSAFISLALLAFALLGLPSTETREQLADFVDAATGLGPPAVFGLLFCAVSAFLNVRHLRWLAQPAVDRYGQATGTLIAITGAILGFLTPVPAFYGLARLILGLFDPPSDDGVYAFAGVTVLLGLLVALALRPTRHEYAPSQPARTSSQSAWSVSPPTGQARVSAFISLGLLIFALLGLTWAGGRGFLVEFVRAAFELTPSAVLGCVLCAGSAFLNVRHLRWLAQPVVDRYGQATGTLVGITGAILGFLTPVLAFQGLAQLLLAILDPPSDDGAYAFAGLTVLLGVLLALALHPRPDRDGRAAVPWQAYAAGLVSALLFVLALYGLDVATADESNVFEGFVEALEDFGDAPEIAILLMLAECGAGAYLYVEQAGQLMRPRAHKLGTTLTAALSVVAALVGLLVPFLAFGGWFVLLDSLDLPLGEASNWVAGAAVAIMLALGIGWQRESAKAG